MTVFSPQTIKVFLVSEARLLDERRWEEWLDLFTEDAWYWVPIEENQQDPRTTVSLIYDDRRLLETRVRRLAASSAHAQRPQSRTSHIVANATVEEEADEFLVVRSKFQMIEYRRNTQRLFGGTQWHGLVNDAERGMLIRWKKVELVNCDSILDGLSVPF